MGVVLAACWEQAPLDALRELEGKVVAVSTTAAGGVAWREATREELPEKEGKEGEGAASSSSATSSTPSSSTPSSSTPSSSSESGGGGDGRGGEEGPLSALLRRAASFGRSDVAITSFSSSASSPAMKDVKPPRWCGKWAVAADEFTDGVVGAKSKNLAALRRASGDSRGGGEAFPSWIKLPPSTTLPFGTFEAVLDDKANAELKKTIAASNAALEAGARGAAAVAALEAASAAAMALSIPRALKAALAEKLEESGVPVPATEPEWELAFNAMRSVWASQFNELALVSMRRVGLPRDALRMAVLVQRVVPAAYAFVIHTRNPATGDDGEVFCELVAGLGEAIVSGAVPGSALAFAARKEKLAEAVDFATGKVKSSSSSSDNGVARVLSYPSKGAGFFVPESLIFRSDSNGEDLPGYAGAGLYSSVSSAETVLKTVRFFSFPPPLVFFSRTSRRKKTSKTHSLSFPPPSSLSLSLFVEISN